MAGGKSILAGKQNPKEQVVEAVAKRNNRPGKRLDFKKNYEVVEQLTGLDA